MDGHIQTSDFHGKRVTVMGLGLHGGGVGVVRYLARHGARVLVTDLRGEGQLKESLDSLKNLKIKYILGQHRPEDFTSAHFIIKNPAVPDSSRYLELALKSGARVLTDVSIFFDLCPAPIIGITGTKGKSTVASLAGHILKQQFQRVWLGGNIRVSMLGFLDEVRAEDKVVLELSSFQLESLANIKVSPHVALITSVFPDHLDRYPDFTRYINAKSHIFRYQKPDDILILSSDDSSHRKLAEDAHSRVYFYGREGEVAASKMIVTMLEGAIVGGIAGARQDLLSAEKLAHAASQHRSIDNLLAASAIGLIMGVPAKMIRRSLENAPILEGRMQQVAESGGVTFINDTAATVPQATIKALEWLDRPEGWGRAHVVLIAGGKDKNLDYSALSCEIPKRTKKLLLFEGTASEKIQRALSGLREPMNSLTIAAGFKNMPDIVRAAMVSVSNGDVILLSPGAASFGLFTNEFDRGRQFVHEVKKLS